MGLDDSLPARLLIRGFYTVGLFDSPTWMHTRESWEATDRVLCDVRAERKRRTVRWGDQSHLPDGTGPTKQFPTDPMVNTFRGDMLRLICQHSAEEQAKAGALSFADILLEEVAESLAESDLAKLCAELIRVAAVTVQMWIEVIDKRSAA
ncbi:MAG: hypothetical protein LBV06_07055 [Propionibacteriaceae bacterium]|nr:hypothetical protein [Propionibacteriaceae bacterium]